MKTVYTRRPIELLRSMTMALTLLTGTAVDGREVIPQLLRTYCIGCHNNVDREAGVSLLSSATIQEGSEHGSLLDKEDASDSRLLQVLRPDADLMMPPEGEPQPTAREREILRQWVLQGAPLSAAIAMPQVPKITVQNPATPLLSSVRVSDSDVCVGGINRIVRLNTTTGGQSWEAVGEYGKITRLTVSADGQWIVAACGTPGVDGQAIILQANDGQVLQTLAGHSDAIYAVALDSSGKRLATAGYDRQILIHDLETQEIVKTMSGHNGSVFDLSFDPAGQVLCSASADSTIKVWNVVTGQRLDTLSQPQSEQYCVAVTPDSRSIVAAGADNRIRVWSLVSLEKSAINPLRSSTFAHEQTITSLALSADGTRLATAAEDGTLRVWSMQPFTQLISLPQQDSLVTSLVFLNNRQLLATRLDGSWKLLSLPDSAPPSSSGSRQKVMAVQADVDQNTNEVAEAEGNDTAAEAQQVSLPVRVTGTIHQSDEIDRDCFQFQAVAGQTLVLEITAASNKSPLDSVVEVLDGSGDPVLRTQLQAVRDSWFTFRGKNSNTSDDFRVFYWQEMELDNFLYSDGEVVKLWHYPRGPDSGFQVYPGFGSRHTWFGTTPTAHAMLAPCYVVVPRAPSEAITPNGLPVFPVYYRNDDDPRRQRGSDSRLFFTAPADGIWTARVSDAREFQGADYKYQLDIRTPNPDYSVSFNQKKIELALGTGQEIEFAADRIDGFTGPVTIEAHSLPPGFAVSRPVVIQQDQFKAQAALFAESDATQPTPEQVKAIRFVASADIDGSRVEYTLAGLEELTLKEAPKIEIHIDGESGIRTTLAEPLQLQMKPGETIRAFVRVERSGEDGIVSFGKADAGRNLPHGVFVDNIGLSGLLLPAGTNEREFFIKASPIVPPGHHQFFLKSNIDGITSFPVALEILSTAVASNEPVVAP